VLRKVGVLRPTPPRTPPCSCLATRGHREVAKPLRPHPLLLVTTPCCNLPFLSFAQHWRAPVASEIHHTPLLFGRIEPTLISATPLRTQRTPRRAFSPFQMLRPPPSSPTPANCRREPLLHGRAVPEGIELW